LKRRKTLINGNAQREIAYFYEAKEEDEDE
jgi:hypothetical protein